MVKRPDIGKLSKAVLAHFPNDDFVKSVLVGCMRVMNDAKNPIRGNFVASGLREIIGHVLHKLASDEEIRKCVWFVQAEDTNITRAQRAKYIVQAGLTDEFVCDKLNIDVDGSAKPLLKALNTLHKSTHVRPETILSDKHKIEVMLSAVLMGLDKLMKASKRSRHEVTEEVANIMQEAVFENLLNDTIQNLDELSSHTSIDGHYIDDIEVTIDASEICYYIYGQVEVGLQYGSNSDVRNDMGFETSNSYPYTASVSCIVTNPMAIKSDDIELNVNTDSFYE